ncbi:hypothetical protein CAC42_3826 [Sphaceloma murrayae]|uniref:General transcription and DNA repair factor IIH n=1 Tax=Sphaceloma murrayae TaxID=2082308 RepID=A0A2K1QI02_9PEZI|nr:hypothetical protein CAC42_3826 [Sphaceloma murrayae]
MADEAYSPPSSDPDIPLPTRRARPTQAWEAAASRNWDLHEDASGDLTSTLTNLEEASKRKRLLKDTTPLQRGIIRHTLLILDLSTAMLEKDLRPNRFLLTIQYVVGFIGEFFEQNPISQLGILGMRDGIAVPISEVSGNPVEHVAAVRGLRGSLEPKGNPSLQNALEMARGWLYHTPSHGTREVVIVLGALLSSDPGDIYETIRKCVRERIRVGVIGLAARMHICAEIVGRTNAGDESGYSVAVDEVAYRELLMGITTPPVVRATDREMRERNKAGLLMMGFPSRVVEEVATLCACHGRLERGGYECSRCRAKVCGLPSTCPGCDLTLILSTHLARSYHHLFPLMNWVEVSWKRAAERNTVQCFGCLSPFPTVPAVNGAGREANARSDDASRKKTTAEGASESGSLQPYLNNQPLQQSCKPTVVELLALVPATTVVIRRTRLATALPPRLPLPATTASGEQGHVSRECQNPQKEKTCYGCGETGHISRECPKAGGAPGGGFAGGAGGAECYKCGKTGHIARNCRSDGGFGGGAGYGGGFQQQRGGQTCYSCGGFGHLSRDCSSMGGSGQKCFGCGEVGHISKNCPAGGSNERLCYTCKQPGHISSECPSAA